MRLFEPDGHCGSTQHIERPECERDRQVTAGYYRESDKKRLLSTGSYFDGWAGRGDTANRDVITDSDAVAVSMLSVPVPAKAMVGLADPETGARITALLEQITTDVPLSSLNSEKAAALLTGRGPAALLWRNSAGQRTRAGESERQPQAGSWPGGSPRDSHLG